MERDELVRRLTATFVEELEEHVRSLNADLLALEREGKAESIESLLRSVHTLKGAARSVDAGLIASACHRVETLLGAAREGGRRLERAAFELLFAWTDAVAEAGRRLAEGRSLDGSPLSELLRRLEREGDGGGARTTPPGDGEDVRSAPRGDAVVGPEGGGSVRVSSEKLDRLLTQSGELLVARRRSARRAEELGAAQEALRKWEAQWRSAERSMKALLPRLPGRAGRTLARGRDALLTVEKSLERLGLALSADGRALDQAAEALDVEVRRLRMLPFAEACRGLDRAARDLALASGKELELSIEGAGVELDRGVLEGLKAPLLHLVRNAVDHGLETPEERASRSKPREGRVVVSAALRGSALEVGVSDDGRGLDLEAIRSEALRRGLPEPQDERDLVRLVFLPGFSTSARVTELSGRGVGLDAVKSRVEALHGAVELRSEPGRGARFTLTVPLTLTTLRAVLVSAGGQVFAFLASAVERLVRVGPRDARLVEGRRMLVLDGHPIPLAPLAGHLGLGDRQGARPPESGATEAAVVLASGGRRVGVVVDELLSEQDVLVKGLGRRLARARWLSGATILPDGRVALILNASELLEDALGRPAPLAPPPAEPAERAARKRLLVVDDSVTTRSLLKSILEAAGYDVRLAVDGNEAWASLQEKGADLVVSDVDMPRLDGFGLTEAIRGSNRFRDLPVVLVTALETDLDRARGAEAGADAYLPKSAFDQRKLLETIHQLL